MVRMPDYISSKAGAEVFCCKKVWMSDHSLQKAGKKSSKCPTIYHQKQERRCLAAKRCECPTIVCKMRVRKSWNFGQYIIKSGSGGVFCKVWMSDHSLQKASKKRLEFPTIHHQNWERRCFTARCECPTMVCKKQVRKGWNFGQYIIKSRSGGVFLQEGVNVQP